MNLECDPEKFTVSFQQLLLLNYRYSYFLLPLFLLPHQGYDLKK